MAYASLSGRARTSATRPQAHAICDRCGVRVNFVDLISQHDWRGPVVQDLRIFVCRECLDDKQEQLRSIVLPADPEPIINARPQDFVAASTDYRAISRPPVIDPRTGIPIPSTDLRITEDCKNRTLVPYGNPTGLDANAIMPLQGAVKYGVPLPVLSVFAVGCTVTITCSAVHNLQPGYQVSVQGLTAANGVFSVTINSATSFSYQTIGPQSPQLTPTALVKTAIVGLPRGFQVFPMTVDDASAFGMPTVPNPPTNVIATLNPGTTGYFLLTENGQQFFVLEDGTTFFEQEGGPATGVYFLSENGFSYFVLEDGVTYLSQETGVPSPTFGFVTQNGNGYFVLQDGSTFLEQETGP